MKLWFRVDAASPRDPTIAEFAARLGVPVVTALGHCIAIWSAMAEHAEDGSLAHVSDATLEAWAMWTKRKGMLATAFRALFIDETGLVHGWLDRQGKLLQRMERDRARHRKPVELPQRDAESSGETPRSLLGNSTSTERNGTEQDENEEPAAAPPPAQPNRQLIGAVGEELAVAFARHVAEHLGRESVPSFVAAAVVSLDGMHGPALTPAQLTTALTDYVANRERPNLRRFRGYLNGATPLPSRSPPPASGRRPSRPERSEPEYGEGTQSAEDIQWTR